MIDVGGLAWGAVAALVAAAFVAGFIDAIAGGGGLITVPSMALAGLDPVTAIATNKLQSSFGSGSATLAFARAGRLRWRDVAGVVAAAGLGSIIGANLLTRAPLDWVRNALPIVLVLIAAWFALSPRLVDSRGHARISERAFSLAVAPLIGCYDGAFGPGTGSFFMLAFVGLRGLGAIEATGRTKAANFASNVAGLLMLAFSGHVVWALGLAMGAGQFAGAHFGARVAMRLGAPLIRPLLIAISLLLAVRLAWDRWL